jgi:hypothetical protein
VGRTVLYMYTHCSKCLGCRLASCDAAARAALYEQLQLSVAAPTGRVLPWLQQRCLCGFVPVVRKRLCVCVCVLCVFV